MANTLSLAAETDAGADRDTAVLSALHEQHVTLQMLVGEVRSRNLPLDAARGEGSMGRLLRVFERRWDPSLPKQREHLRGIIAVGLLFVIILILFGAFLLIRQGKAGSIELKDLLGIVFPSIVGLLGAATGFYFGERSASEKSSSEP